MAVVGLFARALFVGILEDLRLGMVLGLLDGACLGVLSVDQLLMLGLGSLFGLGLRDFHLLLLLLELLDALSHLSVVLLLDLLLVDPLFLDSLIRLLGDLLDGLLVVVVCALAASLAILLCLLRRRIFVLLGNNLGGLLGGATAATELLLNVLNDGVVVAGEGLRVNAMQVLVGDLILELGLDLGADTLHDLARGDLLLLVALVAAVFRVVIGSRGRARVVAGVVTGVGAGAIISRL